MCSTPKTPSVPEAKTETVKTPTLADASVSKAATNTRNTAASTANKNVKTSARGITEEATTNRKSLLGGSSSSSNRNIRTQQHRKKDC